MFCVFLPLVFCPSLFLSSCFFFLSSIAPIPSFRFCFPFSFLFVYSVPCRQRVADFTEVSMNFFDPCCVLRKEKKKKNIDSEFRMSSLSVRLPGGNRRIQNTSWTQEWMVWAVTDGFPLKKVSSIHPWISFLPVWDSKVHFFFLLPWNLQHECDARQKKKRMNRHKSS